MQHSSSSFGGELAASHAGTQQLKQPRWRTIKLELFFGRRVKALLRKSALRPTSISTCCPSAGGGGHLCTRLPDPYRWMNRRRRLTARTHFLNKSSHPIAFRIDGESWALICIAQNATSSVSFAAPMHTNVHACMHLA